MLNYQSLSEWLRYDPATGYLWWLQKPQNKVDMNKPAGFYCNGYIHIGLHKRQWCAHRLAWLLYYKVWPTHTIDHINRNPADNRIVNLRDVPLQRNLTNSTAHKDSEFRVKGITYDYKFPSKPYRVEINRHGKTVHRSNHATLEAATKASNDFYSTE